MLARKHWHRTLTDEVILEACQRRLSSLDNPGFCLMCGAEGACEPDAENYECEACGARQVFGAEALLIVIA